MAASDVTVTQNGGQNVKLHPYLVALVRWCVSCLWSTATIVLHRIMLAPRPAITGSPKPKPVAKPRAASQEHIDPEPRVECVVLHQPTSYKLDVIFVHGLYGSLRNTWRQGEWKTKYKVEPNKVPLMRSTSIPSACKKHKHYYTANNQFESNIYDSLEKDRIESINNRIYEDITKILPNENVLITENFYDNALLEQVEIIDNYETQAQFVSDLFKSEIESSDDASVECSCDDKRNENDVRVDLNDCECRLEEKNCRVGCGCLCDECYSTCWPRDWIKEDYPDARVISINYTSDPYLWRPLWVKEIKRLRLHERAEQMTRQLLDLGVGERPVIWVGHSKGGLFIKQIYCEAYEAHLKLQKEDLDISKDNETNDNSNINREQDVNKLINNVDEEINDINSNGDTVFRDNMKINVKLVNGDVNESKTNEEINEINKGTDMKDVNRDINENTIGGREEHEDLSLKTEEDSYPLGLRRRLWQRSAGFMFYSVPHRGSPLADIKTPLTQRSLELQEICKDCPLVLDLHSRWLAATSPRQPVVRSLVETGRTLMSVLWLRIVSKHSADPGLGALCGVSVDHREICKPASRTCLLYSELMNLMHAALDRCRCQQQPAERDVKRE